jgi:hypothetical protein
MQTSVPLTLDCEAIEPAQKLKNSMFSIHICSMVEPCMITVFYYNSALLNDRPMRHIDRLSMGYPFMCRPHKHNPALTCVTALSTKEFVYCQVRGRHAHTKTHTNKRDRGRRERVCVGRERDNLRKSDKARAQGDRGRSTDVLLPSIPFSCSAPVHPHVYVGPHLSCSRSLSLSSLLILSPPSLSPCLSPFLSGRLTAEQERC